MNKIFLSHKSEDKVYVEKIVDVLGKDNCVYDKYTFEEGMPTLQEILRGIISMCEKYMTASRHIFHLILP